MGKWIFSHAELSGPLFSQASSIAGLFKLHFHLDETHRWPGKCQAKYFPFSCNSISF